MVLLDAMMQVYKCHHRLKDLQTIDGKMTGMEFGFIKSLEALRKYFKDEVILCWEGRNNFRYKIDPEYKANRQILRDDDLKTHKSRDRINKLREFLLMIAESASDDELEADDVIASLAKQYSKTEPVIIYSADKDLHQLLCGKSKNSFPIHQLKAYKYRDKLWTPAKIEEKYYGLTPKQFIQYQAWHGDTIDSIPGCGARKTIIAAAICKGYGPHNMSDYVLFSAAELRKLDYHYDSGRYQKNLELVTLRIKSDIKVIQRDWQPDKIGQWLKDMSIRTLKLCLDCGIEPVIADDEEF